MYTPASSHPMKTRPVRFTTLEQSRRKFEDVVHGFMSFRNRNSAGIYHDIDKILLFVADNRCDEALYDPFCVGYYCHVSHSLRPVMKVVVEYRMIFKDV